MTIVMKFGPYSCRSEVDNKLFFPISGVCDRC